MGFSLDLPRTSGYISSIMLNRRHFLRGALTSAGAVVACSIPVSGNTGDIIKGGAARLTSGGQSGLILPVAELMAEENPHFDIKYDKLIRVSSKYPDMTFCHLEANYRLKDEFFPNSGSYYDGQFPRCLAGSFLGKIIDRPEISKNYWFRFVGDSVSRDDIDSHDSLQFIYSENGFSSITTDEVDGIFLSMRSCLGGWDESISPEQKYEYSFSWHSGNGFGCSDWIMTESEFNFYRDRIESNVGGPLFGISRRLYQKREFVS
jgi:hypothetical protein